MNVIERANQYANLPEHNGCGYTLLLTMVDGSIMEAAPFGDAPLGSSVRMEWWGADGERVPEDQRKVVFVNTDHVVTVEIDW